MPASPLISQEDHLHFFRMRLEDIIIQAIRNDFEVVIIDHPPGLFGISTASFIMMLKNTRLNKLYRTVCKKGASNESLNLQAILITTPDPVDYKALLPSLSWILEKNEIPISENILKGKVNLMLNKAVITSGAFNNGFNNGFNHSGVFDPVFALNVILNNVKEFTNSKKKCLSDTREVNPELIKSLEDRAKEIGALACKYIERFDMRKIFESLESLKSKKGKEVSPATMQDWCVQIGKSLGLYIDKKEDLPFIKEKVDEKR